MARVHFVGSHSEGSILKPWQVKYLVIHRLHLRRLGILDKDLDGAKIIEAFKNPKMKTKGRPPYHAVVKQDAGVEQMLPLAVKGAHAVGYNWQSWGIAVVGDFTKEKPVEGQTEALLEVCRVLAVANSGLEIVGHTELPGASDDPNKVCPGEFLPLPWVRGGALICDRPMHWPQSAQEMGFEL